MGRVLSTLVIRDGIEEFVGRLACDTNNAVTLLLCVFNMLLVLDGARGSLDV